jgi:PTS system galactitol-specific IIC component
MGAAVFLPIVVIILGLAVRMKLTKAFSAGLTLGVAFVGINLLIGYMMDSVGGAAQLFVLNTGLELNALDLGWAPALGLAWQWEYAFLMFPVQIGINIVMLAFGWTSTLNVDMWNVANKIATGFLVTFASGSLIIGLAVASVQVVLELKNADLTKKQLHKLTNIPGVSMPHPMFLSNIVFYPITLFLDKVIKTKTKVDVNELKRRIGIFGENHVLGFIIGTSIGLVAEYGIAGSLMLGIQTGTALTLFPMVSKLFMTALAPVSDATNKFIKSRFPDRDIVIGLDWPILAGNNEIWVTIIASMPIALGMAMILPGNTVLPLGNLMTVCVAAASFMVTRGDLIKMIIINYIWVPIILWSSSYFAPMFTELAAQTGGITNLPEGQMLAWYGMDITELRWMITTAVEGNIAGIILTVLFIPLTLFYFKGMKQREEEIENQQIEAGKARENIA